MLSRKPPMLLRVALVNEMGRAVWALLARERVHRFSVASASSTVTRSPPTSRKVLTITLPKAAEAQGPQKKIEIKSA